MSTFVMIQSQDRRRERRVKRILAVVIWHTAPNTIVIAPLIGSNSLYVYVYITDVHINNPYI